MTQHEGFFSNTLEKADNELFSTIKNEIERQSDQIELIASENIVSNAVLEAQGSIMTSFFPSPATASPVTNFA